MDEECFFGRSSDGRWTAVGRPLDGRCMDGQRTVVGRLLDSRQAAVGQPSDGRCQLGRPSDGIPFFPDRGGPGGAEPLQLSGRSVGVERHQLPQGKPLDF